MKKMILTILICGVMILGITGCGNNSDSISTEDKQDIVNEIENYVEQDSKSMAIDYRDSYEATVTDIKIEGLKVTFSGKMKVRYYDGSKNDNITFEGTTSLKPNPYAIYNTYVDYNYN